MRRNPSAKPRHKRPFTVRPYMEMLEDRLVPTTFTVNTLADTVGADPGVTSLREAITAANRQAGPDIIQFASGVTGTIILASGELSITDSVDLQGPGAGGVAVSGNNAARVFRASANVTIRGLTITTGRSSDGAGIYINGTLTVDSSILSGNVASFQGGGIQNTGTLTVVSTTVSANSGVYSGGIVLFGLCSLPGAVFKPHQR